MQSCIGWLNLKRLIWHNLGCLPSTVLQIEVYLQHVVCLQCTESVRVVLAWLWAELISLVELELACQKCLLHSCEAGPLCLQ